DTYGHPVGDEVLEEVAGVLCESVREIDVPARYGGEEFAVILEETRREGAVRVAERIRRQVAGLEFVAAGDTFSCTVSLGLAVWPAAGVEPESLLDTADEALYASKENGRNQVTVWEDLH
ncbi:MAG: GGDEF domain-containing protein, partial [Bradymonadaceae bacterium]